jgi:hypothetical protein
MRRTLSSLTPSPAMAVAVAALLLAGGGLAIAGGTNNPTIRACANKRNGALRVARKCRRGERAVSWNKVGPQGPRGLIGPTGAAGAPGQPGATGAQGLQGPGATSFTRSVAVGPGATILATLPNGTSLRGLCPGSRVAVAVVVTNGSDPLQASGTAFGNFGSGPELVSIDENETLGGAQVENVTEADIDVVARDAALPASKFAHIDLHGSANGASAPCAFWGMIIPAG